MSNITPTSEQLMNHAKSLGIHAIHRKIDTETGLEAYIAMHETTQSVGPAIGGARFQVYEHANLALEDAINLAYRMALKSAAMGLPHGGAKAVIRAPENPNYDRGKLFEALGAFVDELNGTYITSLDAGTNPEDMDNIIKSTQHVIGASPGHPNAVDPSIYTAYGVFKGMQAALEHLHGQADFSDKTIAIQGAGHVASHLVNYLLEQNAKIVITDINDDALDQLPKHSNLRTVAPQEIFDVSCDIFCPCALGGIINEETIKQLKSSIIVGAANNQLSDNAIAAKLHDKDILYLPDFIVNAGGVISASDTYYGNDENSIYNSVDRIYDISKQILSQHQQNGMLPYDIAIELAKDNLKKAHEQNK